MRKMYVRKRWKGKVRKVYIDLIMNEENDWGGDAVVCVIREEMIQAFNEMETGIVVGPSDVS